MSNPKTRRPTKGTLKDEWQTPPALVKRLNDEFGFRMDVCASQENHHSNCIPAFWDKTNNSLEMISALRWVEHSPCWMNPPYSKVEPWVRRCHAVQTLGGTVVALLPAAVETRYFHQHVIDVADEVRLLDRRLQFVGASSSALGPNLLVVYRPHLGPTRWPPFPLTPEEAGRVKKGSTDA